MKHATNFLAFCLASPWAMELGYLKAYSDMLIKGYLGTAVTPGAPEAAAPASRDAAPQGNGIAVINVFGPIVQRSSMLGMCDEGIGCDSISRQLAQANADPAVGQILMNFDSPGGSVFGVMELAEEIRTSKKPVVGFANATAASAAYWMLASCSEVWVTPSGQVGSIGVYLAHEDVSKALEAAGINVTLVSAGEYKVEANPFAPLGEDAKNNLQSSVDAYYSEFVRGVAKGRKTSVETVREDMGKGRMLKASDAVKAGMADKVGTFAEVVKSMSRKPRVSASATRAMAAATLAHL